MAYAVSIGSGYSKFTVRFPTAQEALAKAKDEIEHGAEAVTITIAVTQETFTVDQFEAKLTPRLE